MHRGERERFPNRERERWREKEREMAPTLFSLSHGSFLNLGQIGAINGFQCRIKSDQGRAPDDRGRAFGRSVASPFRKSLTAAVALTQLVAMAGWPREKPRLNQIGLMEVVREPMDCY